MTRSEMVIDLMTNRGATLTGGSQSSFKKKREEATFIHWGDIRLEVGKTYLYIEQKLMHEVLYHGVIPPNKVKFEELLQWLGINV